MVKRGTTTSRRGRKPASLRSNTVLNGDTLSPQQITVPKEAVARKTRGAFKGKLAHTSPILDMNCREKKITGYFSPTTEPISLVNRDLITEVPLPEKAEVPRKNLALQKVFGRGKVPLEKEATEVSPHKIVLKTECVPEIVIEPSEKVIKEEEPVSEFKEPKPKATKVKKKLNVNQSLNQDSENHKLTEYFAVRRSVRKPKTAILEEKQRDLEEAVESGREDGLMIHNFPGKGRGIVATRLFRKSEFVVEYAGDLIDLVEARERERNYAADQNTGCYMYYFHHKDQSYCVDATAESPRLGRLVNHSRTNGNLLPKVIEIKDRPRLLLVAKADILPGDELLYDYGDRSKVSLKHHPWLAS